MKKLFFWFFVASISVSFPHKILAQDPGNAAREKIITQQMDCIENQYAGNKSIGWNDVCEINAPSNSSDSSDDSTDSPTSSNSFDSFDKSGQIVNSSGQVVVGTKDQNEVKKDDQSQKNSSTDQIALRPFDPISTRIVSDPLFQPLEEKIYGETSYTYSRNTYKSYFVNPPSPIFKNKDDYNTTTQELGYGVTDDLALYFTDAIGYDKSDSTYIPTGDIIKRENRGLYDPTFDATYRVLDQVKYPVDINLSAYYSPNAISSKFGDRDFKGSVAPGRESSGYTVAVGREMSAFTIRAYATAVELGELKYEYESSSDTEYKYKSSWEYTYGVETQTRLTDKFSVNLSMGYTLADNLKESNVTTGVSWTQVPPNNLFFSMALNYDLIPNKLVGGLTYEFNGYSNSKSSYADTSLNTEVRNDMASIFGLRLQYLFN